MKTLLKILSLKHKNNKLLYYSVSFIRLLFPKKYYQSRLNKKISSLKDYDIEYIKKRINYYNKLEEVTKLSDNAINLGRFMLKKRIRLIFLIATSTPDILAPN